MFPSEGSTADPANGLRANWYTSQGQKVELKIFKWGVNKGPYTCWACSACWGLQYDRASTMGSSIGTVELIDDEKDKNDEKKAEQKDDEKKAEQKDEQSGWVEMETLQVWKIKSSFLKRMSDIETFECAECEAQWTNIV